MLIRDGDNIVFDGFVSTLSRQTAEIDDDNGIRIGCLDKTSKLKWITLDRLEVTGNPTEKVLDILTQLFKDYDEFVVDNTTISDDFVVRKIEMNSTTAFEILTNISTFLQCFWWVEPRLNTETNVIESAIHMRRCEEEQIASDNVDITNIPKLKRN